MGVRCLQWGNESEWNCSLVSNSMCTEAAAWNSNFIRFTEVMMEGILSNMCGQGDNVGCTGYELQNWHEYILSMQASGTELIYNSYRIL